MHFDYKSKTIYIIVQISTTCFSETVSLLTVLLIALFFNKTSKPLIESLPYFYYLTPNNHFYLRLLLFHYFHKLAILYLFSIYPRLALENLFAYINWATPLALLI